MITARSRFLLLVVCLLELLVRPASADGQGLCSSGRGASGPNGYTIAVSPSGTTSTAGTSFTLSAQVTDDGDAVSGFCVDFVQSTGPSSGWPRSATTDNKGIASVTWTSTAEGTDSITAEYKNDGGQLVGATARHTWAKAAPTPTPTPTPVPTVKPTRTAAPSTKPTPSPSRSASPTPHATATATATASASATPSATASPSPSPSHSPGPVGSHDPTTLHLDRPSTVPGGSVSVRGAGCPAGAVVAYSVEGAPAGTTTASPDGSFAGSVQLPDASLGQHEITATCEGRSATVPVDLVVSSSSSASSAAGATAVAVLVFFVLLGSVLFARNHGRNRPTD